jgi:predicted amidohydrolase YtcJ
MSLILALLAALVAPLAAAEQADLLIRNARLHTAGPAGSTSGDLAVKGSIILAVGGDLSGMAGAATRVIDARGRAVLPGIVDAHGHLRGLGERMETLDLTKAGSASQAAEAVARAADSRRPGEWILGRGWDQTRWPGGNFPDSEPLDRAAPRNPVFLTRVDGHAAWVNRLALESADINAATKDPPGGRIVRDAAGAPAGVLVDRAMAGVRARIPPPTQEQVKARIARAAEHCVRLGLTSVHDAGVGAADIAAYEELIRERRLPLRVYAMIGGEGELWRIWLARGPLVSPWLTVRSIKLVADGALGSRGAALKEPYSDDLSNRGLMILSRTDVERVARQALARGFQVNTHAIGDRANREVLEAYGAVLGGPNSRRFRIEHAQVVSLDDIPLFARFSVIASMQATHATSDMRWAEQRLGAARIKGAYAWRRMISAGVRIANGSDFPVEDPDPIAGFHASVARGGWQLSERLTRQEALHTWTIGAAYAEFAEKSKGSLEAGKLADFVVLSRDILAVPENEITGTKVDLTVVDGVIRHEAGR